MLLQRLLQVFPQGRRPEKPLAGVTGPTSVRDLKAYLVLQERPCLRPLLSEAADGWPQPLTRWLLLSIRPALFPGTACKLFFSYLAAAA